MFKPIGKALTYRKPPSLFEDTEGRQFVVMEAEQFSALTGVPLEQLPIIAAIPTGGPSESSETGQNPTATPAAPVIEAIAHEISLPSKHTMALGEDREEAPGTKNTNHIDFAPNASDTGEAMPILAATLAQVELEEDIRLEDLPL